MKGRRILKTNPVFVKEIAPKTGKNHDLLAERGENDPPSGDESQLDLDGIEP
jgi:hypothetical protein